MPCSKSKTHYRGFKSTTCCATTASWGSSGSGVERRAWRERRAVLRVRAGLHWSFRMSKQMAPFWLLTFGCLTTGNCKNQDKWKLHIQIDANPWKHHETVTITGALYSTLSYQPTKSNHSQKKAIWSGRIVTLIQIHIETKTVGFWENVFHYTRLLLRTASLVAQTDTQLFKPIDTPFSMH